MVEKVYLRESFPSLIFVKFVFQLYICSEVFSFYFYFFHSLWVLIFVFSVNNKCIIVNINCTLSIGSIKILLKTFLNMESCSFRSLLESRDRLPNQSNRICRKFKRNQNPPRRRKKEIRTNHKSKCSIIFLSCRPVGIEI